MVGVRFVRRMSIGVGIGAVKLTDRMAQQWCIPSAFRQRVVHVPEDSRLELSA